jgi:hypothetical protein
VSNWGPMFGVDLGMSRQDMLDLSVPEMVDMIDYANEVRSKNG